MPDSPATRQSRLRERRKAGTPWEPLICSACPSPHRGRHGDLCSRCWERLTPEGRAAKAERVRQTRARQRAARSEA